MDKYKWSNQSKLDNQVNQLAKRSLPKNSVTMSTEPFNVIEEREAVQLILISFLLFVSLNNH